MIRLIVKIYKQNIKQILDNLIKVCYNKSIRQARDKVNKNNKIEDVYKMTSYEIDTILKLYNLRLEHSKNLLASGDFTKDNKELYDNMLLSNLLDTLEL